MIAKNWLRELVTESDGRVKLASVSGIALLAAALVLAIAVLPAGADAGPATVRGIEPTERDDLGGQPNDCRAVGSAAPFVELRIQNPTTGEFFGEDGAKFNLVVNGDDTLFSFDTFDNDNDDAPTAFVYDIVVKGGQKSTHFDYDNGGIGLATLDSGLHAPTKGGGSRLFSVSHVSICYGTSAAQLSGTVYEDLDLDRNFEPTADPAEVGQGDITVTVYNGASFVRQDSTVADGTYSFYLAAGTYTVCEEVVVDTGPDPYVEYGQTEPSSTPPDCSSLGDHEDFGYVVGLAVTDDVTRDFGNAPVACGQTLNASAGQFLSGTSFTVFEAGDGLNDCDDKLAVLEVKPTGLLFGLSGSGEFAAIGTINKSDGSSPPFDPLKYAQDVTAPIPTFYDVPWCGLRDKVDDDPDAFDAFVPPVKYPKLAGLVDNPLAPVVDQIPSTVCKVYEEENLAGLQQTVVYAAADPFFR